MDVPVHSYAGICGIKKPPGCEGLFVTRFCKTI